MAELNDTKGENKPESAEVSDHQIEKDENSQALNEPQNENEKKETAGVSTEPTPSETQGSPEDVLHQSVCRALVSLKNKDFPLLVTTFYSKHVLAHRSDGTTIDLKATSYKKFGNYVKVQVERGLMHVGPDKKNPKNTDPMALLIGYTKKHDDIMSIDKASCAKAHDLTKKSKMVMVNLYIIPKHWPELLNLDDADVKAANATSEERKGTGMLTGSEARKIVESYVERENLIPSQRRDQVVLDAPLTQILFKKSKKQTEATQPPERLLKKEIVEAFKEKCLPAYAFVKMPGSRIAHLAKGSPSKIEIEVAQRQSKKYVTRVRGLENYEIDPVLFSKDVTRRLACSSTIETEARPGKPALKPNRVEVVFQGSIYEQLEALLVGDESLSKHGGVKGSDYAVPKQVLDIALRKGVPGRQKGGKRKGG